jgi:hypothetical protein
VSGGALGLFGAGTADGHVAMWYSSNGQRWIELAGAERVIGAADDPHVDGLLVGTESGPSGVYAAGWLRSGSSMVAAMWSSGDGIHWQLLRSAQTAFAGPGDHMITSLAAFGTGLIAVGGSRTGSGWTPASWLSPNGVSWSEPSTYFPLGARPQPDSSEAIARDVSAIPTGLHSAILTAVGGGPTVQRLWTSLDGLHWTELALPPRAAVADWKASLVATAGSTLVIADAGSGQPHVLVRRSSGWLEPSANPALFGAVQATAQPTGLASSAAGLLLAVQVDHAPQSLGPASSSVSFLSSPDATTWTPAPTPGAFAGSVVEGVAASPAGYIAVGRKQTAGRERATVWSSPDGMSWQAGAPLDSGPLAGSDQADGVCAAGPLLVAVGRATAPNGVVAARAWVSRDGVHWSDATIVPPALAGVSTAMTGCLATPVRPGSYRIEAYGAARVDNADPGPAYWTAVQPTEWTRQTASPFGANFPFPAQDVARTGNQWLATAGGFGADVTSAETPAITAGQSMLWRSADGGASWVRPDTSGSPWVGATVPGVDRVAWLGTTPVAAGAVDGRLAVWTGILNK